MNILQPRHLGPIQPWSMVQHENGGTPRRLMLSGQNIGIGVNACLCAIFAKLQHNARSKQVAIVLVYRAGNSVTVLCHMLEGSQMRASVRR